MSLFVAWISIFFFTFFIRSFTEFHSSDWATRILLCCALTSWHNDWQRPYFVNLLNSMHWNSFNKISVASLSVIVDGHLKKRIGDETEKGQWPKFLHVLLTELWLIKTISSFETDAANLNATSFALFSHKNFIFFKYFFHDKWKIPSNNDQSTFTFVRSVVL